MSVSGYELEHFGGDLWVLRGADCTVLEGSAEEWCSIADALLCGSGEAGGYRCRARWVTPPPSVLASLNPTARRLRTGHWEIWSPRNAVSSDDRELLTREAGRELWRAIASALTASHEERRA